VNKENIDKFFEEVERQLLKCKCEGFPVEKSLEILRWYLEDYVEHSTPRPRCEIEKKI
jgi:hypothetical protein